MEAKLHHRAPNTYFGQWLDDSAAFHAGRFTSQCPQCDSAESPYPQAFD
jgi:hypothetical protein